MTLLTINVGSSSCRLVAYAPGYRVIAAATTGEEDAIDALSFFIRTNGIGKVTAVAHRVVHGGSRLTRPCLIDAEVEAEIQRLARLAPLHNPKALEWIRAARSLVGEAVPQIAVFDTALYADLPPVAQRYALPRALCEKHAIRRYGFHGLAHEAMWRRWTELHPRLSESGRVISIQLGSGCSMTAFDGGRAVDTSMGFSPIEGLVMATRSGDVDPGVLTFLQRAEGLTPELLEDILNRESGLLGASGVSANMEAVLASSAEDARQAVELYCYRARKYLGGYLAALGGADAVLFGGGVGEHAAPIRSQILIGLDGLGILLDPDLNGATLGTEKRISSYLSKVEVWVIPVDEALVLARAATALMQA